MHATETESGTRCLPSFFWQPEYGYRRDVLSLITEILDAIALTANTGQVHIRFRLAPGLTKGGRGRTIRMPARLLTAIRAYVDVERAQAVWKFLQRERWSAIKGAIYCRSLRQGRLAIRNGNGAWINTSPIASIPKKGGA